MGLEDDIIIIDEGDEEAAPDPSAVPKAERKEATMTVSDLVDTIKIDAETAQNEWGRAYRGLKTAMGDKWEEVESGPVVGKLFVLMAAMAKMSKYTDIASAVFQARIAGDEELQKESFGNPVAIVYTKFEEAAAREAEIQRRIAAGEYFPSPGIESASTQFVSNVLWGETHSHPTLLAAKLYHSKNGAGQNYFKAVDFNGLPSDNLPYGTVLIFTADKATAEKGVAYATGDGKECKYYDPGKNRVVTFNLGDENTPIASAQDLQLAFIPAPEGTVNPVPEPGETSSELAGLTKDLEKFKGKGLAKATAIAEQASGILNSMRRLVMPSLEDSYVKGLPEEHTALVLKSINKYGATLKAFLGVLKVNIAIVRREVQRKKSGAGSSKRAAEAARKGAVVLAKLEKTETATLADLEKLEKLKAREI